MLTGPIRLLGLVYFPSVCPPTGPRVCVLRTCRFSRERAHVRLHARIRTRLAVADGARIGQVRKDGYVWTRQVLFVRFSYVGDPAASLSVPLRPILLLAIPTVSLSIFQLKTRRCHLVACIELLNRHSDRQLIAGLSL